MHSFTDFKANCDLRGDLHDVVGHLRLVDGHPLHPCPVLCITSPKVHCLIFSYKEISDAMCGFDRILHISEGGFGSVYKAIINDPTATGGDSHYVPLVVAVKRFKR
ncbi:hypothetical protein F2Q70_00031407 [Brassica cretica]|uniref:Protein kinase domain-containing protein n=2 Tax=Brassica cretica TaxID=69181 RepID=A0A8S9FJZ7_BRACR|nr:hypothetical protein F2Q70_00031407 [Brassica cretica]KAF2550050.1 hypothetical protein F2Q68_00035818 [Brassica cretica]KAF3595904.1 hypothetical protein DY000_02024587 [Brassica cretica]